MRKWLFILVACVVLGFSLLAHVPALVVIPDHHGKFQFLGIDGTVWRGEIQQIRHSGHTLPIRNLRWTVRPTALLTGTIKADFHEQQTPRNRGSVRLNLLSRQLGLNALHWQMPGSSLDPWFRAGAGLQGRIAIDLEDVQLAADTLLPGQLKGRLDWQDAVLRLDSERWPIGSPVMQFSGDGESIKGVLRNSQPLLPGEASFQCTTTICLVELSLQPTAGTPQSLLRGLLLLGLQQTGGSFSGQITVPIK